MALHTHLIEQARHLAEGGPNPQGTPRQADLRRAVSAAYYALFHFLIDEACKLLVGAAANRRLLRATLSRGFDHAAMLQMSKSFAGGTLPKPLMPALAGVGLCPVLRSIANRFVSLQEARHAADYNRLRKFRRAEVLQYIDQAERAFVDWAGSRETDEALLYVIAILVGDRIRT